VDVLLNNLDKNVCELYFYLRVACKLGMDVTNVMTMMHSRKKMDSGRWVHPEGQFLPVPDPSSTLVLVTDVTQEHNEYSYRKRASGKHSFIQMKHNEECVLNF
jgi:hypothetical protein